MATTTPNTTLYRAITSDDPVAAARAGRSLAQVLRNMGHGYARHVADEIGVYPKTIRNWTSLTVPLTPVNALKICAVLAKDLGPLPDMGADEVAQYLFNLLYDTNHVAASIWILDSFSTHFPCDELLAAS